MKVSSTAKEVPEKTQKSLPVEAEADLASAAQERPKGSSEKPGRYLALFCVVLLLLLLGISAFNVLVDPFDIYRLVKIAGLNNEKPMVRFHDRMHKAHAVRHSRPDTLILGTSRAQIGLGAGSSFFEKKQMRALNLALPTGSPYEALRYLQHAHAARPVGTVIFGLDPLMFNARANPLNPEFKEERLAVDVLGLRKPLAPFADLLETTLSWDAVRSSLRALRRRHEASYLDTYGTRDVRMQEEMQARMGGARKVFIETEKEYFGWFQCFSIEEGMWAQRHWQDFEALLNFAAAQEIDLKLFVSPAHARHNELIFMSGHWASFERWKARLLKEIEKASPQTQGRGFVLWDFSSSDTDTTEAVPPLADSKSQMKWYWDSSHYTVAMGDRILRVLFSNEAEPAGAGQAAFGKRLSSGNLPRALAVAREAQEKWRAIHPLDVKELQEIWAKMQASPKSCEGPVVGGPQTHP